eukprot:1385810-Pyramimonas_sp.AAC.1
MLLLSITNPAADQVAIVKLHWPPDLGGAVPSSDCQALGLRQGAKYPSNECIAAYDVEKFGEFHADDRIPRPPN